MRCSAGDDRRVRVSWRVDQWTVVGGTFCGRSRPVGGLCRSVQALLGIYGDAMPIPTQIRDVYDQLRTEITWLHGRWIIYRQLYGTSEKRIDLLNESAAAFFYIVQDVLLGEIQVSLSKLTDPARTGAHENLSLELLQSRLETVGDTGLAGKTRVTLGVLRSRCAAFRTWRNKKLAHLDLLTSMQATADPLPGISRQMVEDALKLVRDFMNEIEKHYNDAEFGYEHFSMQSDGEALVAILRYGLRYEELLTERSMSYDDIRDGKWHNA